MRVVTFKVDEELLQQLDVYCVNNANDSRNRSAFQNIKLPSLR